MFITTLPIQFRQVQGGHHASECMELLTALQKHTMPQTSMSKYKFHILT